MGADGDAAVRRPVFRENPALTVEYIGKDTSGQPWWKVESRKPALFYQPCLVCEVIHLFTGSSSKRRRRVFNEGSVAILAQETISRGSDDC